MNREELIKSLRTILEPIYESTGKMNDLMAPCKDCGKKNNTPRYVHMKAEICPDCDFVIRIGATDGYAWVRQ
mgnify:CR=1 FL=1